MEQNIPDSQTIELVMRQTNYDANTAKEKLILFNGDVIGVIRDYLGVKPAKKQEPPTLQQQMYGHFREFLKTDEIPIRPKK